MSSYHVKGKFKYAWTNEWGQKYVYCPVSGCEEPFRVESVLKHIIRMCKVGDPNHVAWKGENMEKISTVDIAE